jgi:Pseudouridylate synthases, 23S RNA-specific
MKQFIYGGTPKKLTKVLADVCPLISYNQVMRLLKNKDIKVNGTRVGTDVTVESGSVIVVYVKDVSLKTVFEDANLLIVYKPKGLASEGEVSAESIMRPLREKLILCHRLDTNTDGLLIFAKSQKIADEITAGFFGALR